MNLPKCLNHNRLNVTMHEIAHFKNQAVSVLLHEAKVLLEGAVLPFAEHDLACLDKCYQCFSAVASL